MNGDKVVLGLWIAQTEVAKFWLQVAPTWQGCLLVAFVIDVYARRIVGW
jgi:transposase InsO family protein